MRLNYHYPHLAAHTIFFEKSVELLRQSGCDIDICFNIFEMFKSLNDFPEVNIRLSQPLISDPNKIKNFGPQLCILMESLSESLIEKNIMSKDDIVRLKTEIQSHSVDENTLIFLSRMTQIWSHRLVRE